MIWQRDERGRAVPIDQPGKRAWHVRAQAFKLDRCQGEGKRHDSELHVHHVNRDVTDCRPENLLTLCRWCHAKAHGKRPDRMGWKRRH